MKESQMQGIMNYIASDTGALVTDDMRKLWLDQFGKEEYERMMTAARLLIARKRFDRFPRCADMWDAIHELDNTGEGWGASWDLWAKLAAHFGSYQKETAYSDFQRLDPIGAHALGSMYKDFFTLETSDMNTFRAQYRQRYEFIQQKSKSLVNRPRDMVPAGNPIVQLVQNTIKRLGAK